VLCLGIATTLPLFAQPFTGTNAPNTGSDYAFAVGAGVTNLSLVVSNNAGAYSYLLLKRGGTPTASAFDFIARLNGATNQISLENPEFAATNYGVRLFTPAASAQHGFNVVLHTNHSAIRSATFPAIKPVTFSTTGSLTNSGVGAWHYFQVD